MGNGCGTLIPSPDTALSLHLDVFTNLELSKQSCSFGGSIMSAQLIESSAIGH